MSLFAPLRPLPLHCGRFRSTAAASAPLRPLLLVRDKLSVTLLTKLLPDDWSLHDYNIMSDPTVEVQNPKYLLQLMKRRGGMHEAWSQGKSTLISYCETLRILRGKLLPVLVHLLENNAYSIHPWQKVVLRTSR